MLNARSWTALHRHKKRENCDWVHATTGRLIARAHARAAIGDSMRSRQRPARQTGGKSFLGRRWARKKKRAYLRTTVVNRLRAKKVTVHAKQASGNRPTPGAMSAAVQQGPSPWLHSRYPRAFISSLPQVLAFFRQRTATVARPAAFRRRRR